MTRSEKPSAKNRAKEKLHEFLQFTQLQLLCIHCMLTAAQCDTCVQVCSIVCECMELTEYSETPQQLALIPNGHTGTGIQRHTCLQQKECVERLK